MENAPSNTDASSGTSALTQMLGHDFGGNMENDSRYPYTYACDYLRGLAGYGEGGTKLSRSEASQVHRGIADALGMADDELARKLADFYKANQDALTKKSCEAFARSQAWPNVEVTGAAAASLPQAPLDWRVGRRRGF